MIKYISMAKYFFRREVSPIQSEGLLQSFLEDLPSSGSMFQSNGEPPTVDILLKVFQDSSVTIQIYTAPLRDADLSDIKIERANEWLPNQNESSRQSPAPAGRHVSAFP